MKMFVISALFFTVFCSFARVFAAPLPAPAAEELKITVHVLESGEKKSSMTMMTANGGTGTMFLVSENKKFSKRSIKPLLLDNKTAMLNMQNCAGEIAPGEMKNISAIKCPPEKISQMAVQAKLNEATIVDGVGPDGKPQEYFIFVEKVPVSEAPEITL